MESAGEYDYVIVAAGTAGCLLANRLTRRPATRILLIEAGGKDDCLWIRIPVGYLYCIDNPRTDWLFPTEREPRLGGRALLYARAKALGGSAAIDGMTDMRGLAARFSRIHGQRPQPAADLARPCAPQIAPNYLGTPEDRKVAAAAPALTRRIVAAPARAKYRSQAFKPGPHYRTEEQLAKAAGLIGTTIFHPVGTCRMGAAGDPLAVVDSRQRVKGVARLRVVDASAMPWITSGNTNAPTLRIAEKAAQLIHDTH